MSRHLRQITAVFYENLETLASASSDEPLPEISSAPKGLNESQLELLSQDIEVPFEQSPENSNPILP